MRLLSHLKPIWLSIYRHILIWAQLPSFESVGILITTRGNGFLNTISLLLVFEHFGDKKWLISKTYMWKLKILYLPRPFLYTTPIKIKGLYHVCRNYQWPTSQIAGHILMNFMDLNNLYSIKFPVASLWNCTKLELYQWHLHCIYREIYNSSV